MELKNFSSELQVLSFEEANDINGGGGESLWYWIAYGISATAHKICSAAIYQNDNAIRPSQYR